MANPVILRSPDPYPLGWDRNGISASSQWTIYAKSKADALWILQSNSASEITRGTAYRDPQGSVYDSYCICQRIEVEAQSARGVESPSTAGYGLYIVTCYYGYPLSTSSRPATTSGQAVWRMERATVSEQVDVDLNGQPITNAAGQVPQNPPTVLRVGRVLVGEWIRYCQTWWDALALVANAEGCINASEFHGAPAKCLFCHPFDIVDAHLPTVPGQSNTPYRITARLEYKPPFVRGGVTYGGWECVFPNMGTWIKSGTKCVRTGPNHEGYLACLSVDGTAELPIGSAPNYRVAQVIPTYEFASLGI